MKKIKTNQKFTVLSKSQLINLKGGETTDESGAELRKTVTIKRG